MANTCPQCQIVFYSDTEFREHQFQEWLKTSAESNARLLNWIAGDVRAGLILKIAQSQSGPIDEAVDYYWSLIQAVNRRMDEIKADLDG